MGSSCWIVARGWGWCVVTRAPSVKLDRPMRPEMGAVMVVCCKLIRAASGSLSELDIRQGLLQGGCCVVIILLAYRFLGEQFLQTGVFN